MTTRNKLSNNLIRKVQKLSADKLTEVDSLLSKTENKFKSKEKTLKLAGAWKDLSDDLPIDLTEKLHHNRANDRQIN
jgi:mRNA-degrading endonuclease YafQ of YafQ-DinJ toxin-antitoxin module